MDITGTRHEILQTFMPAFELSKSLRKHWHFAIFSHKVQRNTVLRINLTASVDYLRRNHNSSFNKICVVLNRKGNCWGWIIFCNDAPQLACDIGVS